MVLLGDFLHDVQNRHRRKARPRKDREDEAQSRRKNVDVLRIVSENTGRHAHHVVHAACDVHHRARKEHGHDDEDHVQRHRSRGQPQAENGHTDADTAQLSRIHDAAQEQNKMYPNHGGSLCLFIKPGSGRVPNFYGFMTTAMQSAGEKTDAFAPEPGAFFTDCYISYRQNSPLLNPFWSLLFLFYALTPKKRLPFQEAQVLSSAESFYY